MKNYVFEGMRIVRERNAGRPKQRGGSEIYQSLPQEASELIQLLRSLQEDLHLLPEYVSLVNVIEADEVIGPQIGQMVGTPYTLIGVSLERVTDDVIAHCLEKSTRVSDEDAFEERYADLENWLYTTEVPQEELDLLGEFTSEILPITLLGGVPRIEDMPIQLLDKVEIVELTPSHLQGAAIMGLLPGPWMPGRAPACAIRHTWTFPRRVSGQPSGWTVERLHRASLLRRHITELTIAALRLFQDGWVIHVGTLAYGAEPTPGGTELSEMYPPRWRFMQGKPYHLTANQVLEFVRFWRWLFEAGEQVQSAGNRFSEARYHHRPEDHLLDLVIAAEALFGGGGTQEVSYKVRLRAAAFLGQDAGSRRQIFEDFKTAYDLRSTTAHGGKLTKRQRQQKERLPQLIMRMEQHIRDAFRRGASMSKWPSTHQEWDDALLGALGDRLTFP
jgi:hypothetical protein